MPMKLSKIHTSTRRCELNAWTLLKCSKPSCILINFPHNSIFWDLLEGVWRRGCRVQCARFDLRVCEWSTGVHAAGLGDAFGKQACKDPHDAGLDKH
jgi:hypothetical protein